MSAGMIGARERLVRWFETEGLSQSAMAARLGCQQSQLSRALAGQRGVGLALAVAIERESAGWSEGPILAKEWADAEEPPAQAAG